jgi:putative ABC transport system substrate-binding protein
VSSQIEPNIRSGSSGTQTSTVRRDILPHMATDMIPSGAQQMAIRIGRRRFITALGGAIVAWPLTTRAQQAPMPVIGFLGSASPDEFSTRLRAFREGLKQAGFVEGQNVGIVYRWTEGQNNRLSVLAAELVQNQVTEIVAAGGTPSAMAAKAATAAIPIVFAVAIDPVNLGLVASLNRPGGNMTGVTSLNVEIGPKRLELLRELLPTATTVAVLVNPANPGLDEPYVRALQQAAGALGFQLRVLNASAERDFDTVFATLVQLHADALVIGPDVFFNTQIERLAALSLRHAVPAIFPYRAFAAAGGLISYGSDETEYYRLVGICAGKILAGEKPADLPVQQSTKVELIVNLKTAKALGITVPLPVLGRADEVIE